MSKKKKSEARDKRKKEKRTRKASNAARYAAMRDAGQNQKSKRFQLKHKRVKTIRVKRHPTGACGNAGCERCSPVGQLVAARKADIRQKIARQRHENQKHTLKAA